MGKTLREKAILAMLGMAALYAFAVILWFVSAESSWKKAAKAYDKAKKTYQNEVKLIGEKRKWTEAYENEKATMPTFEAGKATDTTWRRKLDEIAAKHLIVNADLAHFVFQDHDLVFAFGGRGFHEIPCQRQQGRGLAGAQKRLRTGGLKQLPQ